MQNPPTPTLPPLVYVASAVATLLVGALSSLVTYLLTKPKQSAEIGRTQAETHKAEAEAIKAQAEARQIDSAIMAKVFERLDDYETVRHRQSEAIADLENSNFDLEYQVRMRDVDIRQLKDEISILHLQLQKAKAQGFSIDRPPHSPNPAA